MEHSIASEEEVTDILETPFVTEPIETGYDFEVPVLEVFSSAHPRW